MKKLSKCKRLLCLTLSMISLFAILAVPQASAEAVSYPNEGLEGQAIGGVQPLAYLISGTGVDFFNDKRFSGGSLTFTVYTETLEPVKKLGVVDFKLQRFNDDEFIWEDYIQFNDYFSYDTDRFSFTKEDLRVLMHSKYRLCMTHYAEKHIFSKQRISKISNEVEID